MGAMRKAGIWLGLVEDEEDRTDGYEDEFGEDGDFVAPVRPRPLARQAVREHPSQRETQTPLERELRLSERASERGGYGRDRDDHDGHLTREPRETHTPRDTHTPRETQTPRDTHTGRDLYRESARDPHTDLRVRTEEPRPASVRPLARPGAASADRATFPTQDNLALAPQVQLRERAVVTEEKVRRLQITTLHPTSFNEARTIGEHFRDGYPVIMNLTEMDEPDARRLVDFAAGLAFGLRGSMDRVTNRVFLLTPENIKVSAEDKARIAEGGFFDQG